MELYQEDVKKNNKFLIIAKSGLWFNVSRLFARWRLLRNVGKKVAANLPSNFSFHAQSTRACCATRRERERNAREERRRRTSSHDTTQARSSRGGVGGEKSIRLVVGRFLRGQEVGQACPCPPPCIYAANVRSICTVVRRDGRGSFDSTWKRADATIPRADPPWRESLRAARSLLWQWAFPPVSSNFRPAPANCLPNRDARFIRPITWKRYLPNRRRFHRDEIRNPLFPGRNNKLAFPSLLDRRPFSGIESNPVLRLFFFLIGSNGIKNRVARRARSNSD